MTDRTSLTRGSTARFQPDRTFRMLLPLFISLAACTGDLATLAAGPSATRERQFALADSGLRWSDAATWPDGRVPQAGADVVVPEGRRILLDVSPAEMRSLVVRGTLVLPLADTTPRAIVAGHVEVRGTLEAGTAARPYRGRFTLTLTGRSAATSLQYKALAVYPGGTLELHGRERLSWTRLARTAEPGATQLVLADAPDWAPGDRIVIAPSGYSQDEAETRIVRAVDGKTVRLDAPLAHRHAGTALRIAGFDVEQRAEVGVLTRDIRLEGDAASETSGVGGHVIVFRGGVARVDGVEFHRMGQRGELARYPMHWHMADRAPGQYVVRSSVWRSYNRCVTVHGTHDVTVADNVCYDHTGHGFFLEDGVETNNTLERNLGLVSRPGTLLGSDAFPATFWVAHPDNAVDRNVSAGSVGNGFWYAPEEHPTGPSATAAVWPSHAPLRSFRGNLAHSTKSDGLHVSGEHASYSPRAGGDPRSASVPATFVDFTAYKTVRAFWSRGDHLRLERPILVDNEIAVQAGEAGGWAEGEVEGGLIVGWTDPSSTEGPAERRGVLLYDGPVRVRDVTFVNLERSASAAIATMGGANVGVVSGRFAVEGSRFVDARRVRMTERPQADGDRMGMLFDADGTLTGTAGATVVPDDAFLLGPGCEARPDWTAHVCRARYAVVHLDAGEGSAPASARREDGRLARYAGYTPSALYVPVRTRGSYTIVPDAGSRARANIFVDGLPPGEWVIVAVPVAETATRAVPSAGLPPLEVATSLDALRAATGSAVYRDGETGLLWVRIVGARGYERNGVYISPP